MTGTLVELTLVVATTVEDEVIEVLLGIEPPLGGFTSSKANGHGLSFADAAMAEQVRGRMGREVIRIVVEVERVPLILEQLRNVISFRHGIWWTKKIEEFGRL